MALVIQPPELVVQVVVGQVKPTTPMERQELLIQAAAAGDRATLLAQAETVVKAALVLLLLHTVPAPHTTV